MYRTPLNDDLNLGSKYLVFLNTHESHRQVSLHYAQEQFPLRSNKKVYLARVIDLKDCFFVQRVEHLVNGEQSFFDYFFKQSLD